MSQAGFKISLPLITVAGTVAQWKCPSAALGGGVTIVEAFFCSAGGTIAGLTLIDMGAAGTAPTGTVCTFAGTAAANVPQPGTPGGYFVTAGNYVGLAMGAGTLIAPGHISVNYIQGR